MPSGMDRTPPIFDRPFWADGFFWIMLATATFWVVVIWLAW